MKRARWMVALAGLALILVLANWDIAQKRTVIAGGQVLLLELRPVDPRSLMQGDYMALRFSLARELNSTVSGTAPIVLDENSIARLDHANNPDSLRIRYRIRGYEIWLGTNAYFFEEGTAERYERARYGEFRLDKETGEAVLVGLVDANFRTL